MLDLEKYNHQDMYGFGGTEIATKQKVGGMMIDEYQPDDSILQHGETEEMHGFDDINRSGLFT